MVSEWKYPFPTFTVLLIDDQEFVLNIVSIMLKKMGFGNVLTATDGVSALKMYRENTPDLLICDIKMKPMDGVTFLYNLRESGLPKSTTVPLIFLTGDTRQSVLSRATELGCSQFLLKPVSPEKLHDVVLHAFGFKEM